MKRRRFFLSQLPPAPELWPLPERILHYARHVLRLSDGDEVELFDGSGTTALGTLQGSGVAVERIQFSAGATGPAVAAPLLKGERTDWMVEKLCELGAEAYIPLLCERAQLQELSSAKRARLERVAAAAARQCGRLYNLRISAPLALAGLPLADAVALDKLADETLAQAWLSPASLLVIGPEGGFSDKERAQMANAGARLARLGRLVLRVETAALAAISVATTVADGVGSKVRE